MRKTGQIGFAASVTKSNPVVFFCPANICACVVGACRYSRKIINPAPSVRRIFIKL